MSTTRKGRRQLVRLRSELSERDLAVLGSVAQLRLVSGRQIERRHFRTEAEHATALGAARSCRRVLERLTRDGLLIRLERRIGGIRAGSASFVYAIGPAGQRLAGQPGLRRRHREPSLGFVSHTLAIAELWVRLHEAADDGDLQLLASELEPRCWRATASSGSRVLLKPDLFVVLAQGEYEYRWFVEVDLGTEHRPAIIRKCQAYEAYYRSGAEQAKHAVFPRVLWVASDQARAEQLRAAIDGNRHLTHALFVVTTVEQATKVLAGGEA